MLRNALYFITVVSLVGCTTSGSLESLESRLRGYEDRIGGLQSHLDEARSQLAIARRENHTLRKQLADRGEKPILPEQADVLYRAVGIQFSELMTGVLDQDASDGDELLNVVLVPHDADGDVVKLPGSIQLDALDLSRDDDERLIGRWEFSLDESRSHWERTWFGTGYQFSLPWQQVPQSNELLLHAKLITPDHREFNATTTVQVNPPSDSPKVLRRVSDSTAAVRHDPVSKVKRDSTKPRVTAVRQGSDLKAAVWHDPVSKAKRDSTKPPVAAFRQGSDPDEPVWYNPDSRTRPLPKKLPMVEDGESIQPARRLIDDELPVRTSDRWTDVTIPRLR